MNSVFVQICRTVLIIISFAGENIVIAHEYYRSGVFSNLTFTSAEEQRVGTAMHVVRENIAY